MYRKVAFFWVKLPCETIGEAAVGTCFYPDICKKLSQQRLVPLHCPFEKVGRYLFTRAKCSKLKDLNINCP